VSVQASPQAELVALARAAVVLVGELQRRVENLQNDLEAPGLASKGEDDEQAEAYVNAILSPLRLARDDDRDAEPQVQGIEPLLNVRGMARLLNVSTKTVRSWRAAKTLPEPLVLGGVLRWRRADVEAWLAQKGGAA